MKDGICEIFESVWPMTREVRGRNPSSTIFELNDLTTDFAENNKLMESYKNRAQILEPIRVLGT